MAGAPAASRSRVAVDQRAAETAHGRRSPLAWLLAGERRVWSAAGLVAVPLLLVIAVWSLVPRDYDTGTNSVEDRTYLALSAAGAPMCVGGLRIPGGTARIRMRVLSRTRERPALHLRLGEPGSTVRADLPPTRVEGDRVSTAIFAIPPVPSSVSSLPATACVTADDLVDWGGTPAFEVADPPPTVAGRPQPARVAVWFMPRAGARRSLLSRAPSVFARAALFRPALVGGWTYAVLLLAVLPAALVTAVRCLALAASGRTRRLGAWLFAIAAINAVCWALITPAFQAPDEVDHFAYTQSLMERGHSPSRVFGSPQRRWSSSESIALEDIRLFTDHVVGDSRAPWLSSVQRADRERMALSRARRDDGGGSETAATHAPPYYLALAPAYLATRDGSIFSQLTLMRLSSALIGALSALFTYLMGRELAPRRPWLGVLAALLVAFEPMYGFISGAVNNDVGVNAGAAALELLLLRMLRRGIDVRWGALTGALLLILPVVKGTAYSLYPVAALVFMATLLRHHGRRALRGWGALAVAAAIVYEMSTRLDGALQPSTPNAPVVGPSANANFAALHHPFGYLSYLWQVFLPRLSFMAPHFQGSAYPGFVIFDERAWGAFGWYAVLYPPWVYSVILAAMLATPLLAVWAARREWTWVRAHALECAAVVLMPLAVIVGFFAAYYTGGSRPAIAEFGRYAFPAIGPLALLVVGALHAFGRPRMLAVGASLLVALLALSYVGQLVTLDGFFA